MQRPVYVKTMLPYKTTQQTFETGVQNFVSQLVTNIHLKFESYNLKSQKPGS